MGLGGVTVRLTKLPCELRLGALGFRASPALATPTWRLTGMVVSPSSRSLLVIRTWPAKSPSANPVALQFTETVSGAAPAAIVPEVGATVTQPGARLKRTRRLSFT